ncbi:MAG TPA: Gfo/Idh/MocA family oxidoreductase [Propionibacteriaceae bacterium]|nr:Gfo/Idh/MocA family oxidoreductase [Propionibacteriaceae bacterium]
MSHPDRLHAVVIGLGWAGQQHLAGYAEAADVDLVALAGMESDALQQLGATYGIPDGHRYTDWRDLIDHEQLDVLSIATPTRAFMSCQRSRWPKTRTLRGSWWRRPSATTAYSMSRSTTAGAATSRSSRR